MRTLQRISFFALIANCTVILSCSKNGFEEVEPVSSATTFQIVPTVEIRDPWSTATTRAGETDPIYMFYLFESSTQKCVTNRGNRIGNGNSVTFKEVKKTGTYSVYCVTGWNQNEYPKSSVTQVTPGMDLNLPSAKDMCLGSTDFTVTADQVFYNITVNVSHIMAQASFKLQNMPKAVTAVTATLPNQANKFRFDGTIFGEDQSQTFELHKENGPDDADSYTWIAEESIAFPYAASSEKMPITITVTINEEEITFNTESATPCRSGMRVAYITDWSTINYSSTILYNTNPWTEKITEDNFTMGDPEKK